jgi:hypothetical protein
MAGLSKDSGREASAQATRRPRTAILNALNPEETTTYRRWARTMLACYCLLLACIAMLASQSAANQNDQVAHASSQKNSPTGAGQ